MKSLSGWSFLIFGGIIAGTSLYINNKKGNNELFIFLVAGAVFMAIGALKVLYRYYLYARRSAHKKQAAHHVHSVHPAQSRMQHVQHRPVIPGARFCPNCGKQITHNGNFCVYCGERIR